ncbi:MAG: transketolase [Isosphaeraceae bacterium]
MPEATTTVKTPESAALDAIQTMRTLAMDAVQAANSGHPGTPVALAPVAYTLWQDALRYDPADADWPDRDRFVLSAGHASMLLYSLIHLAGVQKLDEHRRPTGEPALPLDQIKQFRQLHSLTPGHPESHVTSGVETTTGPLGQGCGNSVGMAIARKWLAAHYNRPGFPLFTYKVYVICGDGDMMEGVSGEAASLAGHLKLDNLCWIYDSNRISIEGSTDLAFTEDVGARFAAYGWRVLHIDDANDLSKIRATLETFNAGGDHRPTFIVLKSHIGYGTSLQDNKKAHGEPLGDKVVEEFKEKFHLPADKFHVDPQVYETFRESIGARGKKLHQEWDALWDGYKAAFPAEAKQLEEIRDRRLPEGWDADLKAFPADPKGMATRISSSKVLNQVAPHYPWLLGGSADLAPSTKTTIEAADAGSFQADSPGGRNFHFGVREHAMGAIVNGMSLCGLRAYGSGFLIFTDYMRGAMRLSALSQLPVIFIFTHDSIGVGEDGPTHQPIEQLAGLRAIPEVSVFRPCDANEVTECWRTFLPYTHEPAILVLTRQDLPTLDRTKYGAASGVSKGAYVLRKEAKARPDVILIGTGSEVHLCLAGAETLLREGIDARVVSMPCWSLFERQPKSYQHEVLPPNVDARVAVEAAATLGWERWVGREGEVIGMTGFGVSSPYQAAMKEFKFTAEEVARAAREQVARVGAAR